MVASIARKLRRAGAERCADANRLFAAPENIKQRNNLAISGDADRENRMSEQQVAGQEARSPAWRECVQHKADCQMTTLVVPMQVICCGVTHNTYMGNRANCSYCGAK